MDGKLYRLCLIAIILSLVVFCAFNLRPRLTPYFKEGVIFLDYQGVKTERVKISNCASIYDLISKIKLEGTPILPPFPRPKDRVVSILYIGQDSHESLKLEVLLASGYNPIVSIIDPSQDPYVTTVAYYPLKAKFVNLVGERVLEVFKAGQKEKNGIFAKISHMLGFSSSSTIHRKADQPLRPLN